MARIVVVGAGISGLSLAYRLQESAPTSEIIVLEQTEQVGGTIQTLERDGFTVEAGPNGFPDNNPSTLQLAREVGLEERLQQATESAAKNRFLFLEGRLRRLPNSFLSFLSTDLLSWIAKLRLITERFRPATREHRDETIDAFARRRVGTEIARTFVDAFVTGILAGDARLISVQAAFPRLVAWERDHGSVMGGMAVSRRQRRQTEGVTRRAGTMWSVQGGLAGLVRQISSKLRQQPRLGHEVQRLTRDARQWVVACANGSSLQADSVVLACPAYRQAEILSGVDGELERLIGSIPYNRVAVIALGYRREDMPHPLDGFGYLCPQSSRRDVLGVQWCSSIYSGRAPAGTVLVRAMCGGWHLGEMVEWSDERLLRVVRRELALALKVRAAPIFTEIIRWNRAIPQYHVGHLDRLARIEQKLTQYPGLYVGGNAYRGVAINDCVEQAGILARRVVQTMGT